MSSLNLVPCPACRQRREFVGIKRDPASKGEIRSFFCAHCDETSSYLFHGRHVTAMAAITDASQLPA